MFLQSATGAAHMTKALFALLAAFTIVLVTIKGVGLYPDKWLDSDAAMPAAGGLDRRPELASADISHRAVAGEVAAEPSTTVYETGLTRPRWLVVRSDGDVFVVDIQRSHAAAAIIPAKLELKR